MDSSASDCPLFSRNRPRLPRPASTFRCPPHPYGVLPVGNSWLLGQAANMKPRGMLVMVTSVTYPYFSATGFSCPQISLACDFIECRGRMCCFEDALMLEILGYCDAYTLCNISCSSRAVSECLSNPFALPNV
jgi:hypothetical protein